MTTTAAEGAVPRAKCRAADKIETGLQGQVPMPDRADGRAAEHYWCNIDLLGTQGRAVDIQHNTVSAWATLDTYDHCAYYNDSAGNEDTPGGTVVDDISDPTKPRQTAYLTTNAMQASWESMRVNAKRGLLVADRNASHQLDVYDISGDCTKPKLLFSGQMTDASGHEGFFSPDGKTYWMTNLSGPAIWPIDLTDPAHPKELPALTMPAGTTYHGGSVSLDGNRVYACQAGTTPTTMMVIDTSGIQSRTDFHTKIISQVPLPDNAACQATYPLFVNGHPYVVQYGEASTARCPDAMRTGATVGDPPRIIDMADEQHPKLVAELPLEVHEGANCPFTAGDASPRSVQFFPNIGGGGVIFGYSTHHCSPDRLINPTVLACGSFVAGLRVYDIRDPLKPRELAYFNMGTVSIDDQTVDDAISRPVVLTDRGLVVWTTEFTGLHVGRFASSAFPFPDAGCGSADDYFFAHYNPTSPCLPSSTTPTPPSQTSTPSGGCAGPHDLTVRIPDASRLRSATISLGGRRTLIVRGTLRRPVTLRGVTARHARVTIVGHTRAGKLVRSTRTYDTCSPAPIRCLSRRNFAVHPRTRGARVRRVTILAGGKRLLVRTGRRASRVDLRHVPKDRITVVIESVTRAGKRVREVRRYRTCAPKD